jgi:hypothetical protein
MDEFVKRRFRYQRQPGRLVKEKLGAGPAGHTGRLTGTTSLADMAKGLRCRGGRKRNLKLKVFTDLDSISDLGHPVL